MKRKFSIAEYVEALNRLKSQVKQPRDLEILDEVRELAVLAATQKLETKPDKVPTFNQSLFN